MSADELLWERFANGDQEARSQLILKHVGLVHDTARRLARNLSEEADFDDLLNSGVLGLIRAMDRFDPEKGAFSTIAVPKIRGAILDDLRAKDPASRSLRRHEREMRVAEAYLSQTLSRGPTDQEVAEHLGVDVRLLWTWREALRALKHLPIDVPVTTDSVENATLSEVIRDPNADDPEALVLKSEEHRLLAEAIRGLRPQERTVLALYYYEDLKQAQIATFLNLTESRVSQIRSKAIQKLRSTMSA